MQHLLLLHGALGHPEQFNNISSFLENDFTLHTISFHGHGKTALPENGVCMIDYVQQIEDYIDELQLCAVDIFGYSMGGYAALAYAAQNPDKVNSIITLATKMNWNENIAAQEIKLLQPEVIEGKVPKFAEALSMIHGKGKWKSLMHALANMLLNLGVNPLLKDDVLKSMTTKVLMLRGDDDSMVSAEETIHAARQLSNGATATLENTQHPWNKVNLAALENIMHQFWHLQRKF